jgi:hypothetical protein
MTTYQDPPLQSRRASRQGERQEAQPSSSFAPPQVPRTAAGAGEPLSYVTQNRPPLPGYDSAPPRGRRASEPVPATAPEQAPAPQFRPRDFSPEARTAPPAWAPEYDRGTGVLDHHTQARSAVVPPAGSLAASLAAEPGEQTLSRRELRALRDAHGITAAPTTEVTPIVPAPSADAPQQPAAYVPPVAPPPPAAPPQFSAPPAPAPSTQLDSAMAEFDALAGRSATPEAPSRRAGRRAAPVSDVAPEDGVDALFPPQAPLAPQAPQAFAPVPPVAPPSAPVAPQQDTAVPPPVAQPPAQAPAAQAPIAQAPIAQAPEAPAPVAPVSPTTGERPVGHWTNQADLDDAEQVAETTISRTVGSAAITTSALVLPSIPGQDMSTGEVMLTDSISLPSALASTGAHTPLDESDIDHLLDPGDHQLVNTDSVPIRAIRAVSSHTSTRGVIGSPPPKKSGRALTALIVSASAMVVVVVTLLVVSLTTGVI